MRAFPVTDIDSDKSLSLVSTLTQEHESPCTKRVVELEARVAKLRAELQEAEAALEFERARMPIPGDFVRCPLTRFFGRVTKVTPRPTGRPWIEIVPYLGPNLPGHSSMDLFDSWELIDPPSEVAEAGADGSVKFPMIAPFMPATGALLAPPSSEDEVEASLRKLWAPSNRISS
ncbi:hypothetical protein [Microvirga sp. VF16]|uniref:hypothetical protein n=1 Tax=Microvirga sp. VF16 TaxID=2807101 RepID=UPI00193D53DC|nr:hypothetical protein [Microvirga sp. VF16]QRM31503.1 hypothetical protein JO965_11245 [Microvirga sp. VF16]